jgi:DNA-binding CsgD family transcriptional regulator
MKREKSAESSSLEMIRLCHSALDSRTLRVELLKCLRSVIPSDYVFFSTTDPSTQLFTSLVSDPTPPWLQSLFLENAFLQDNFNRTRYLLGNHQPVGVLSEQTRYELEHSQRYLDVLASFALGDEMRAIFVTNGACWGTLCLHRERSKFDYTTDEAAFLARLTPHIAEGLRKALLLDRVPLAKTPDGPGVLLLAEDLSVVAMTAAAEYWLMELAEAESDHKHPLPQAVFTVVACLLGLERGTVAGDSTPKVRLRTPSGHWLLLYASRLRSSGNQGQITVIFELAQPAEIAPLIMQVYDLTKREGEVTQCVLRGWSTTEIAATLHISTNTVQDHLKAIFEKVDVGSRRELAARIFTQQYQPHFLAGTPLDASGRLDLPTQP